METQFESPGVCPQGLAYLHVREGVLIRGLVLSDWEPGNAVVRATRKAYKRNKLTTRTRLPAIDELLGTALALGRQWDRDRAALQRAQRDQMLSELPAVSREDWVREFIRDNLRIASKGLLHDLLQLASRVIQNAEFSFDQRFSGAPPSPLSRLMGGSSAKEQDLKRRDFAAIATARLLADKLKSVRVLTDEQVESHWVLGSPHKMFRKIIRLWEVAAAENDVTIVEQGESWAQCYVPETHFPQVPHALLDNAVKYAPRGSRIKVSFGDTPEAVVVKVTSYGPRIERHELDSIFLPSFRGSAAQAAVKDGQGLGLWIARKAIESWGSISVGQADSQSATYPGHFETTFIVRISRKEQLPV